MKLIIPIFVSRIFTASMLPIAAVVALATLAPASMLQAKEEPKVGVVATNATTGYQEAPGVFMITLSEKQDKPVTVLYSVSGHPQNGVDYNRVSGMKVIKAHKTHALINIVPTQKSDGVTGFGSVTLKLKNGKGYKLGSDKSASVEITIVLP
jgi:hypothetical protein